MTKKLEAVVHTHDRVEEVEVDRDHDRDKERLLPEDDPVYRALGLADAEGRIKPSRQAKFRQVEEFLRILDASVSRRDRQGTPAQPDRRGPAADRGPRLRQRLPHPHRAAVPARPAAWRSG